MLLVWRAAPIECEFFGRTCAALKFFKQPFFALHNKRGQSRVIMPTLVSFSCIHAYRPKEKGVPREGQLWNTQRRRWEKPDISEKEQLMGYPVWATLGWLATEVERTARLGQALDANTMRWFGAFFHATTA